MSTFYTVEIPHTRPAQVSAWPSKRDAVWYFFSSGTGISKSEVTTSAGDPLPPHLMTDEEVFEAAGDDLSSFHTFESLKELDEWSRKYASDSRPGGCGGHQSATIRAQVEEILEDSLAEVMGHEGQEDAAKMIQATLRSDSHPTFVATGEDEAAAHRAVSEAYWDWCSKTRPNESKGSPTREHIEFVEISVKEDSEDQERDIVHPRLALEVAQSTILDLQDLFNEHNIELKDPDGFQLDISAYTDEALSMIQMALNEAAPEEDSTPPRKHSTPEDRLTMIHNPGHGWLVVPIADVEASGIKVSAHSYRDKANFYLEEDKDAVAYLRACGYKFGPEHRDHIDIEHRHYKSIGFDTGAVRCVEEN